MGRLARTSLQLSVVLIALAGKTANAQQPSASQSRPQTGQAQQRALPVAPEPRPPREQVVSYQPTHAPRVASRSPDAQPADAQPTHAPPASVPCAPAVAAGEPYVGEPLAELEAVAIGQNPTLRRRQHEAAAVWAKAGYVSKLPDPTISTMFFTPPMNFEPDRQLSDIQYMQMIPWLGRLKAEARRAQLEALVAQTDYEAERLRVVGELRATWYKLYVLRQQIETTTAEQTQLESLIRTANARVRTGDAQPGDVLLATLELSSLQEQFIGYRQQVAAASAELNRLLGREASEPIVMPTEIQVELPAWNYDLLREVALSTQPELQAARLRSAATRWGIEVARLQRRPDLTFGIGWVAMDAPGSNAPGAGRDSLTLGVTSSLPIWYRKNAAQRAEATQEHYAAHATEDEIATKLSSLIYGLWEQAVASERTLELYQGSILPQARQAYAADQQSLINGTVTYDRVLRAYRTLLNLELGYHKARGQLATTLAQIRQAVGCDALMLANGPAALAPESMGLDSPTATKDNP